jgi:fluorothreonine transaldolase
MEEALSDEVLHLTANETLLSPLAQRALATPLGARYLLEHLDMRGRSPSRLGNFLYRGLDHITKIEQSATEICAALFGAQYTEYRCLSGLHAMQTTIAALTKPGDTVMRVATKDGGHFLTELICRTFGRSSVAYAFRDIGEMDLDRTRAIIKESKPTLIFIDAMNYLFPFPLADLKDASGGAPLVFDGSHTLGLIAGGQFQDPLNEGADLLQANTHKTFFGPQKGLILGNDRALMEKISYTLSNGMVSSQHTASTLCLFVALHEFYYFGREYAVRTVENAQYLARALSSRGVPIVAKDRGFTRNHMFFVDTRPLGSGPVLLERLLAANISANRVVAFDRLDTLRIGVQEITRRCYGKPALDQIADCVADLLVRDVSPESVRAKIVELVRSHSSVSYCAEEPTRKALSDEASVSRPVAIRSPAHTERPRWVRIKLNPSNGEKSDEEMMRRAQGLGALASVFEDQTDSAGNLSFVVDKRLYVTASGAYLKDLAAHDFVAITDYSDWTLHCEGTGQPSAESLMHFQITRAVGAAVIVHNHFIPVTDLDLTDAVTVPPCEYGSVELAEAASAAASTSHTIYVRRHGLVFWGSSFEECRTVVEDFTRRSMAAC